MGRFVADTHALAWRLTSPRKLGRAAQRAFDAADSGRSLCLVPAIVFVELALLKERGRLGVGPSDFPRAIERRPGYAVLALDAEQALEFAAHQGIVDSYVGPTSVSWYKMSATQDAASPRGGLKLYGRTLYGTTSMGGKLGGGSLFQPRL